MITMEKPAFIQQDTCEITVPAMSPIDTHVLQKQFDLLTQKITDRNYAIDTETKMALLAYQQKLIFNLLIQIIQRRNI